MELKRKNIVITGGTTGIGYELVKRLHADNALIVIASNSDRIARLREAFDGIIVHEADLSDPSATEVVADTIKKDFGQLDVLINNAAVQCTPSFIDDDFDYASIGREVEINFSAVCRLCYLLMPALLTKAPSAIVNVNSALALAPKRSSAVYCATKAAMNVLSLSLRYQLENTNVSVFQVFMPLVDTPMTAGRGRGKMPASTAAKRIVDGIERNVGTHYIGKTKLLKVLLAVVPWVAHRMMQRS